MTKHSWEQSPTKTHADRPREGFGIPSPRGPVQDISNFSWKIWVKEKLTAPGQHASLAEPEWNGQTQQGVVQQTQLRAAKQTDTFVPTGQIQMDPDFHGALKAYTGKQKHIFLMRPWVIISLCLQLPKILDPNTDTIFPLLKLSLLGPLPCSIAHFCCLIRETLHII